MARGKIGGFTRTTFQSWRYCGWSGELVLVVNAVYAALLIGNIALVVASLLTAPRLLRLRSAGDFVNAVPLVLMVFPLLNLPLTSHPPAGYPR